MTLDEWITLLTELREDGHGDYIVADSMGDKLDFIQIDTKNKKVMIF